MTGIDTNDATSTGGLSQAGSRGRRGTAGPAPGAPAAMPVRPTGTVGAGGQVDALHAAPVHQRYEACCQGSGYQPGDAPSTAASP